MLFMIHGIDKPDSLEKRKTGRTDHVARLTELKEQGRLISAGFLLGKDQKPAGSLIIAEFDSVEEAQKWVSEEPYLKLDVYEDIKAVPYFQALP